MALVNKETWSLLDVHLESVHSEMCILVPREGKRVCQMHALASTAAVGSRNAHRLEYIQISELTGHTGNIFQLQAQGLLAFITAYLTMFVLLVINYLVN